MSKIIQASDVLPKWAVDSTFDGELSQAEVVVDRLMWLYSQDNSQEKDVAEFWSVCVLNVCLVTDSFCFKPEGLLELLTVHSLYPASLMPALLSMSKLGQDAPLISLVNFRAASQLYIRQLARVRNCDGIDNEASGTAGYLRALRELWSSTIAAVPAISDIFLAAGGGGFERAAHYSSCYISMKLLHEASVVVLDYVQNPGTDGMENYDAFPFCFASLNLRDSLSQHATEQPSLSSTGSDSVVVWPLKFCFLGLVRRAGVQLLQRLSQQQQHADILNASSSASDSGGTSIELQQSTLRGRGEPSLPCCIRPMLAAFLSKITSSEAELLLQFLIMRGNLYYCDKLLSI